MELVLRCMNVGSWGTKVMWGPNLLPNFKGIHGVYRAEIPL